MHCLDIHRLEGTTMGISRALRFVALALCAIGANAGTPERLSTHVRGLDVIKARVTEAKRPIRVLATLSNAAAVPGADTEALAMFSTPAATVNRAYVTASNVLTDKGITTVQKVGRLPLVTFVVESEAQLQQLREVAAL